jgi:hypothetical protein
MFPRILSGMFRVRSTNEIDWLATTLFDISFEYRVRGDLHEEDPSVVMFLRDLVNGITKQHRSANVIPTIVSVEVTVEPFAIDSGHDSSQRRVSPARKDSIHPGSEYLLIWLHQRRMKSARNTQFRSGNVVEALGECHQRVDEFLFARNGDSLRRVYRRDPEAISHLGIAQNLFNNRLCLLHADSKGCHTPVAFGSLHRFRTSNSNANGSLSTIIARRITHGHFTQT